MLPASRDLGQPSLHLGMSYDHNEKTAGLRGRPLTFLDPSCYDVIELPPWFASNPGRKTPQMTPRTPKSIPGWMAMSRSAGFAASGTTDPPFRAEVFLVGCPPRRDAM